MIRNIIFDMGEVLIKWTPQQLLKQFDLTKQEENAILNQVFHDVEWIALDAGTMSEDEAFSRVCRRLDEKLHPVAEFMIRKWWTLPMVGQDGIEDLIRKLHENGYRIYVLSNANDKQKEYFPRVPGYRYFSGRVTSAEIGLLKPDRKIFEYICDTYQLKAEECFFIDDSNLNVYAALEAGMQGTVYHDTEELIGRMREAGIRIG